MANDDPTTDAASDLLGEFVPLLKPFARYSPTIVNALKNRMFGKDLALYGHPEAGKTSLLKYLQTGQLADPSKRMDRTDRTYFRRSVGLKLTGDVEAAILVRKLVDRPGHSQGMLHAMEFCRERPHHAIIMLDSSAPFGGKSSATISGYLNSFWSHARLNRRFNKHRIERVWIWLNKADAIQKSKLNSLVNKVEREVRVVTHGLISPGKLQIRSCSLVDDTKWNSIREKLIAEVISDMIDPS